MSGYAAASELSSRELHNRFAILLTMCLVVGVAHFYLWGLSQEQTVSVTVFLVMVMSTLFFWDFRLAIAFLDLPVLIMTKSLELECFRQHCSLEVILFRIGRMVVVGGLRDLGFVTWIIQSIFEIKGMTAHRIILITAATPALTACAVDEVTNILFMAAMIFQVSDALKVRPVRFLIVCVMATHVGSAGTTLGNPVGILIGSKAGLTFEDFEVWSFPIMLLALAATIACVMIWYRDEIHRLDVRLKEHQRHDFPHGKHCSCTFQIPVDPCSRYDLWLGAASPDRTVAGAGNQHASLHDATDICQNHDDLRRRRRARNCVEHDVQWSTLTFFLTLFGVGSTLEYTEVMVEIASSFSALFAGHSDLSVVVVMLLSALGSTFIDNVTFVGAFIPVVQELVGDNVGVHPL